MGLPVQKIGPLLGSVPSKAASSHSQGSSKYTNAASKSVPLVVLQSSGSSSHCADESCYSQDASRMEEPCAAMQQVVMISCPLHNASSRQRQDHALQESFMFCPSNQTITRAEQGPATLAPYEKSSYVASKTYSRIEQEEQGRATLAPYEKSSYMASKTYSRTEQEDQGRAVLTPLIICCSSTRTSNMEAQTDVTLDPFIISCASKLASHAEQQSNATVTPIPMSCPAKQANPMQEGSHTIVTPLNISCPAKQANPMQQDGHTIVTPLNISCPAKQANPVQQDGHTIVAPLNISCPAKQANPLQQDGHTIVTPLNISCPAKQANTMEEHGHTHHNPLVKRAVANRLSAQRSRLKRVQQVQETENAIKQMSLKVQKLESEVAAIMAANVKMQQRCNHFRRQVRLVKVKIREQEKANRLLEQQMKQCASRDSQQVVGVDSEREQTPAMDKLQHKRQAEDQASHPQQPVSLQPLQNPHQPPQQLHSQQGPGPCETTAMYEALHVRLPSRSSHLDDAEQRHQQQVHLLAPTSEQHASESTNLGHLHESIPVHASWQDWQVPQSQPFIDTPSTQLQPRKASNQASKLPVTCTHYNPYQAGDCEAAAAQRSLTSAQCTHPTLQSPWCVASAQPSFPTRHVQQTRKVHEAENCANLVLTPEIAAANPSQRNQHTASMSCHGSYTTADEQPEAMEPPSCWPASLTAQESVKDSQGDASTLVTVVSQTCASRRLRVEVNAWMHSQAPRQHVWDSKAGMEPEAHMQCVDAAQILAMRVFGS